MVRLEDEKLEFLYDLSVLLSLFTDTIESFNQARAGLQRLVPCDVLLIFVNDEERECLTAPMAYNGQILSDRQETCIPYDHPVMKDLMISKQCAESRSSETPIAPGMSRELFVPLSSPEGALGCLYFAKADPTAFTANEITWAKLAAHLLSISLERVQWTQKYSQAQKRTEWWHERYLSLLESFPFPTVVVDLANDQIIEVNEEFTRILAEKKRTVLSKRFSVFCSDVIGLLQAMRKDEIGSRVVELLSADGERVTGLAKWAPMTLGDRQEHIVTFLPNVSTIGQEKQQTDPEESRTKERLESFVTAVSHDLKAPIQSLRSYATFLSEDLGAASSPSAQDYLKRILTNLDQMEQLISGLLNFYQADSPAKTFEWVYLSALVEEVLAHLGDNLRRYDARVVVEKEMPRIFCNKQAMAQVFTNLISNALRYANKSLTPAIEIGCTKGHSGYELFVSDNGIGIDAKDRERIFEPFYSSRQGQEASGTGVGLAVVKKIIQMHDGAIWVEANPAGGAVFKFILPARSEAG